MSVAMRTVKRIDVTYIACIGLLLMLASWRPVRAVSLPMPTGKELTATVTKLDTGFFAAYNDCDLASLARYIAADIQFYHDKSGLMVGRSNLVDGIRDNICGKLRRVLIPGTLSVDPIPGYGALETGTHRFCELPNGNCDALAKFALLWQYRNGTWLMTIVFSYDHHTETGTTGDAHSPDQSIR